MAKASAKCKCEICGCEFIRTTVKNNRREADSWEEWAARTFTVCPDCEEKAEQERIDNMIESQKAEGLPELVGTEKQVRWAVQLRAEMIDKVNEHLAHIQKNADIAARKVAEGKTVKHTAEEWMEHYKEEEMISSYIQSQAEARFWIDHRYDDAYTLISECKADAMAEATEAAEPEAEAADDSVVVPEDATKGEAEIVVTDDRVEGHYPKDDDFRTIVKAAGYRWDGHCWSKDITVRTGSAVDRAAELANSLLHAGFLVRCSNTDVRAKAISGDYEPECKNWISLYTGGQYAGWLCVSIPGRDNDTQGLYDAARRIKGSRYNRGAVAVPMSRYAETADFAGLYGYKFTPKATEAVNAYMAKTRVKAADKAQDAAPMTLQDILASSDAVLSDLEDD